MGFIRTPFSARAERTFWAFADRRDGAVGHPYPQPGAFRGVGRGAQYRRIGHGLHDGVTACQRGRRSKCGQPGRQMPDPVGFGGHQAGDVAPGGGAGAVHLVGPGGERGQRRGEHRPAAQLVKLVLFAVHPVAQRPTAAPAQIADERLFGRGVGDDAFGGVGGGGRAQIGDQIAHRVVGLVADGAHHRCCAPGDLAAQRLVVEGQQRIDVTTTAGDHDHVDVGVCVELAQRVDDLGHGVGALHRRVADCESHCRPAALGHGYDIALGGGRPSGDEADGVRAGREAAV